MPKYSPMKISKATLSRIRLLNYTAHIQFQKSYYGHGNVTSLLSRSDFKNLCPIIIVEMSRQIDNVKTPTDNLGI